MDEELFNLIKKLRDESSFVQSEKRHLLDLYKQLIKKSDHLFNKEWVISSQYAILEDLIMGRTKSTMSQTCARYALSPARTQYIESHKQFGHHDYYVAEFLKGLRERPAQLSKLIVRSEKYTSTSTSLSSMLASSLGPGQLLPGVDNQHFSTQRLVKATFHSLYGNCLLIQDECFCLQLMKHLLEHQFGMGDPDQSTNVDLRRLIRRQSCSFNIMFRLYMTFSHSSQLFLTAALYEPIAKMLNDEWYLDIEPDKALARFSNEDIIAKFGHPSSKEYKLKTQKYREKIVNSLYSITMSFVESISMSLFCFPASLSWLVHQMYKIINKSHKSQPDMARKLCCDLIMAIYICPAICDPEPYGVVSDVQISSVARHNLMQVANVLQVLAMSEEEKDTRAHDLYSKFKPNCVSDILNTIILTPNHQHLGGMSQNGSTTVATKAHQTNKNNNSSFHDPQLLSVSQLDLLDIGGASNLSTCSSNLLVNTSQQVNSQQQQSLLARNSILISTQDVHRLIIYCNQLCKSSTATDLADWLKPLIPGDYLSSALETACASLNNKSTTRPHSQPTVTPSSVYTVQSPEVNDSLLRESFNLDGSSNNKVLIVNINDKSLECPGMLSEEKFLSEQSRHFHHLSHHRHDISSSASSAASFYFNQKLSKAKNRLAGGGTGQAGSLKRGSTLQANGVKQAESEGNRVDDDDDDEVGQAVDDDEDDDDDEIEDVDEANQMMMMRAGVDVDEDEVDDGLSDFDNLSNRDTPIVSGRDTPSSNSHDDLLNTSRTPGGGTSGQSGGQNGPISANSISMNMNSMTINSAQSTLSGGIGYTNLNGTRGPSLPVTVQKPNREDINEKFCKFEINKVPATMSETGWSLDADPPESVANEPINDRLGLDETSVISVSSSVASNNNNSSSKSNLIVKQISQNSNVSTTSQYNGSSHATSGLATDSAIQSSSSNLINFDQDLNSMTSSNSLNHTKSDGMPPGGHQQTTVNPEDSASVVSDSVAWSTDVINNSDNSDLESSNSPSKYTPYSTYSSYSSNQHQLLNQSLLSELAAVAAAAAANATSSSVTSQPSLTSVHSANSNSILTNHNNKKDQASESGLGSSHSQSDNQLAASSQANATSHSNPGSATKNKLSSIFSSNTNSVKFSFGSQTSNSTSNTPNNSKRNALQRIFPFNKSKNNSAHNSSTENQSNQASNPAVATTTEPSQSDNIDSILKKYTKPAAPQPSSDGILIDLTEASPTVENPAMKSDGNMAKNLSSASLQQQKNNLLYYDPENLEQSKLFLDAKKKLRLVFSWSDYCIYQLGGYTTYNRSPKDNYLSIYLKTQLYDVIRLQDKEKEAQLYETLRCISIFSESECNKLLRSLKRDYLKRIYYMTYLTKSKQNLLQSLQLVDKMSQRAESDQKLFTHHFATVVTRLFLETKENEHQMYKFVSDFKQLVAIDEKFDLIRSFLNVLKKDYDSVWSTTKQILTNYNASLTTNDQDQDIVNLGHLCLERLLFSRVYSFVMFPNGEIDQYRDTKFSECLAELASSITPSHPLIGISDIYLNECPWIAAQIELKRLNLYKTPQDKLSCVRKCMLTIQNLLAIAKSPVCADDMHPVLIYVIIKANPSTFLSNVQYIEGFYGSQLESEDYYWAQFKFAYSYIKAKMLANSQ